MTNHKNNIIIIGCGLVGMTLALILSTQKIKVTIVDKNSKKHLSKFKDKRTSAISQGSTRLLKNIGIWEKIFQLLTNYEDFRES